ncbi:MAG: helix-hairpin-helix domain-containing protein [Candidatus Aenigmarchaeota archaeon]|nr:helix-hairpin-helix domain-containing protein [Candidatus Aenigmarchaeota archaeon]
MTTQKKIISLSENVFFDRESGSESKITDLSRANQYDTCGPSQKPGLGAIYHAKNNRRGCLLFKTLYTNACSFDCKYCINTRKEKKSSYTPQELAKTFMQFHKNNLVDGLFLSSGIPKDPQVIMDKMLDTLEIIRFRYRFQGYIHMKVLPGASYSSIKRASHLAERLSINIEAPNKDRLSDMSTTKDYKIDILRRQRWLKNMNLSHGHTTQFVVGAGSETDLEILNMLGFEYNNFDLRRAYFSAFAPCRGTVLEKKEKTKKLREVRLYNIDFLLRKYNFKIREIKDILNDDDNLPEKDPKTLIAQNYFERPVDINSATYTELLHVPGIGDVSAKRIIEKRKDTSIKRQDLKKTGVILKRADPFLKINGWSQRTLGSIN